MTRKWFRLIQLLQILLFLFCQSLASRGNSLIHPLNAAKADNRTADPLVNPGECYSSFSSPFLGKLLESLDNRNVCLAEPAGRLFLVFRARCVSIIGVWPG